ncbi:MAG TPA: carbonate dehydratase [Burkholderiaceae bacterium]|nr:carbonate dehydratase [Burkholderiaceae bacterium]HMY99323.1 carbonate dehydratase [Burkholderiaceae bacterium]HNB43744.1 carbonate dehydratase [Burkholderiaceae bacterium]HNG81270.1 carbonate dehydratase [Burkholderiaceae bacterium]
MSTELTELFEANRRWAQHVEAREPGFFTKLLKQQTPQYLWIGCADSRVPANELVDLLPGELFVHRNVANVVVPTDLNALSVMQYAVDMLQVRHVIVVGHSNCGGVTAALNNTRVGLADNWLRHVQEVRNRHQTLLDRLPESLRVNTLCELNVLEQARNVCRTTVVEDAWLRGQEVVVHGWVYGLHNGLLEDLSITVTCAEDVDPAYSRALGAVTQRALLAMARLNQAKAAALAGGEGI